MGIEVVKGDITEMDVEAIVNAANEHLILGSGVAGAIKRKGGPEIQIECDRIGGTSVGGAVITTGGRLKARYVIHAVGPRMGEGDEDEKLKDAVLNSLKVAEKNDIDSMAFPAISTGIFGFPLDRCARIMIETIRKYLDQNNGSSLEDVFICLYDDRAYSIFEDRLNYQFSSKE